MGEMSESISQASTVTQHPQSCVSCGTLTLVWRPHPSHLCCPLMRLGGAIDPGEVALRAAIREAKATTSLPTPVLSRFTYRLTQCGILVNSIYQK